MWATTWQNQQNACAPSENSVSLTCYGNELVVLPDVKEQCGCPGWSESSLGAHSFCWFCHVAAHVMYLFRRIYDPRGQELHVSFGRNREPETSRPLIPATTPNEDGNELSRGSTNRNDMATMLVASTKTKPAKLSKTNRKADKPKNKWWARAENPVL